MENEHIIGGLMRKRADLAGELGALHDQVRDAKEKLAHVEATLRLFDPEIDFNGARVSRMPGAHAAEYGDMSRAVKDALRNTAEWITVAALSDQVAEVRAVPDMAVLKKRVAAALRNFKRRGNVESRHGEGLKMEWRLVREA